jgi:predicted transposase YdaD
MANSFDVPFKHLVEHHPLDWLRFLHFETTGPVTVVDADVSVVVAEADKVIRVEDTEPWVLHLEAQASHDSRLPERIHRYNALLSYRHDLPVVSVAILLRPDADAHSVTGAWSRSAPGLGEYVSFRYQTVRVWELRADELLEAGGGVLPLSVLTDDAQPRLRSIIEEVSRRAYSDCPPQEAVEVLTASFFLAGLRHATEFAHALFQGVVNMSESSTYQSVLEQGREIGREQGREAGVRDAILALGESQFGKADDAVRQSLESIHNIQQLMSLLNRTRSAASWSELLNGTTDH